MKKRSQNIPQKKMFACANVSELYYRKIFEASQDALLLIDAKTKKILNVNRALVILSGYPEKDFVNIDFCKTHFLKDAIEIKQKCSELHKNKYVHIDALSLRTKRGRLVQVEVIVSLFQVRGNSFIRCVLRDITERMRFEKQLRESTEVYQQQFENMSSGVVVYESKNDGRDFIIRSMNKSAEHIEQVKRKDILGKSVLRVFPGVKQYGILEAFQRVWKTEKPEHFPVSFYKDDRITGWRENYIYKIPNGNVVAIYDDLTKQKQSEASEREQTARFRVFFDRARDAILTTSLSGDQFLSGNQAAIKMFGCKDEQELISLSPAKLSPEIQPNGKKSSTEAVRRIQKAYKTGSNYFEWMHARVDGVPFPATVFLSRVEDGGYPYLFATIRDISEEKAFEEEIQRNLEQQKLLASVSVELNKYENLEKTINSVLKKVANHFDINYACVVEDTLLKEHVLGNIFEWKGEGIPSLMKEIQSEATKNVVFMRYFRELDLVRESNVSSAPTALRYYLAPRNVRSILLIPLKIKGVRFGFIGFAQVSEKKLWFDSEVRLAEVLASSISSVFERRNLYLDLQEKANQINKEKNQIETIVQNIYDGVFVLNIERKIVLFNKRASELSGYSLEESFGRPYQDILKFVFERDGKINDLFIRKVFETGEPQEISNHTLLIRKDDKKIFISEGATPLKDQNGKVIGCVVAFRDVSMEREIDKMKTEFIAVASHQLKTPLSGIKWMSELLLGDKIETPGEKQREFLNDIHFSNERMLKMVDDLLDVSHIESGRKFSIEKKRINVVDAINEAMQETIVLAEERSVRVIQGADFPRSLLMNADKNKMKQAWSNLLNNAIKYSKKNGLVTIGYEKRKGSFVFYIKDEGIGIPEAQHKRVTEKFFRADNAVAQEPDGTGLGLYIVKAIIEAHGGSLWFTSKEGAGSTFYFSLPIKEKN
jgi:PAS domain S-box-containing protein